MSEVACPLQWPTHVPRTPAQKRKSSRKFQMSFGQARGVMLDEIEGLGGRELVLSSNLPTRPDGLPYADGRLVSPDTAVALYFTRQGERLCIACDTYDSVVGNMRGIGLSVKALRQLELHGSSHMVHAALVGFRALPAPGQTGQPHWSVVLGIPRDAPIEVIREARKRLLREHHPDAGGNADQFHLVSTAFEAALAERQS